MRGRSIAQIVIAYQIYVDMGHPCPSSTVVWSLILGPGYRPDRVGD